MAETVYLYVRHTPKMVKVFASQEVKPHGVSKRIVTKAHPLSGAIEIHTKAILKAFVKEFGRTAKRPTLQVAHTLAMQAGRIHNIEYAYIPRCATYPERIRLTRS